IENIAVEYTEIESPIRTGAWRAVYYPPNVFARESFVDEIAARLGKEPPPSPQPAAGKAEGGAPLSAPPGRRPGRGIACNVYHARTVLAQVAEISVGSSGDVRVHRVVTALDCGQ